MQSHVKQPPTIGRVVWYFPGGPRKDPDITRLPFGSDVDADPYFLAQVCFVNPGGSVNLVVTDHVGAPHRRNDVTLWDEPHETPRPAGPRAEWMPYQRAQVRKAADAAGDGK